MSGVKIRGIYSSAITNLLLKNKMSVAQPSDNVRASFSKAKFAEDYTTMIHDFSDKGGIIVKGEEADKVCEIFRKFKNAVIQTETSGHLYLGKIIKLDPNTKNIHVDLGLKKIGLLPLKDYWGYVKEGEKILVQLKNEEKDCYVLSTKIHLFGNNVVLIQKGFTKISNNIKDKEVINLLNNVAEENCEEGWGALWKTSAASKKKEELVKEIKDLYEGYANIKRAFEKEDNIKVLSKGVMTCYIRFDKETKQELDKLRREIKPTIENHHSLKTDIFANIVDFSENLIKEKLNEKKINEKIAEFTSEKGAKLGDIYLIAENKMNGSTNFLKGRIIEKENNVIKIKRFVKSGSVLRPINMSVERGDYVHSLIKDDEWFVKHEFYSKDDELKAVFYSINTPIELQSNRAVAISLELVVNTADDNKEVIGKDLLEDYEKEGVVSKELVKEADKIAKQLLKSDKK
ncbi:MAG: ribonuclease E/G [Nanoarchaeota archaeon]|nr:ribonuclease E/G [Nanoarchaeota archaeon]